MRYIAPPTAADFLKIVQPLLLQSEAVNNLLYSSALSIARGAIMPGSPRISFHVIEAQGQALCAALEVESLTGRERKLLLSEDRHEAAAELGVKLGGRDFTKILGSADAVTRFLSGNSGGEVRTKLALKLEHVCLPAQAAGLMRTATEKDMSLLKRWSLALSSEDGDSGAESADVLRHMIQGRQIFVWEDGRPVAMAGFSGITPRSVRVSMVYTDPRARAKGYARSLVNALSRKLTSSHPRRACFLFVDADNHPALRAYERVGFTLAGRLSEVSALPESE